MTKNDQKITFGEMLARQALMGVIMRLMLLAAILIPSAVLAEPQDAIPSVVDGIEYLCRFGRDPRPGWTDGLKHADQTVREQCRLRLQNYPPPAVCMVRRAPAPSWSM